MKHTPGPWEVHDRWYIARVGAPGISTHAEVKCCTGIPASDEEQHEANARLIAASPELLDACEAVLTWMTNVNTSDPATVGRQLMSAMEKAGYDKDVLDEAAVALVRGPCSVPNLCGED